MKLDDVLLLLLIISVVSFPVFIILGIFKRSKKYFKKSGISVMLAVVSLVGFMFFVEPESPGATEPEESITEKPIQSKKSRTTSKRKKSEKDKGNDEENKYSANLPEELKGMRVSEVREDTTDKWKKVVENKNYDMPNNAVAYFNEYMKEDEIHYLISFVTNTTTQISSSGHGQLYIDIREYEKREEHSAKTIGSGMILKSYIIDVKTGEVEDLDDIEDE